MTTKILGRAASYAADVLTKHIIKVIIDAIMATYSPARRTPRRDAALALSVGLFLFAVYLLSYRGGFHSVDEVSMFAVTESLVKFGRLNTDQIAWTQWTTSQREAQGFFGTDGHVYSKKGLAASLAMAPLYWLGLVTPGLGMLQTASLLNPIVTAITAGLLFRLTRRLGYEGRVAMGVALLYGLATIAWVYSKYLFSEPLAGLLLLATAYLLITFRHEVGSHPADGSHPQDGLHPCARGNWRAALAGVLTGLAVATRANNLFLAPIFGMYLVMSNRATSNEATGNRVTRNKKGGTRNLITTHYLLPFTRHLLPLTCYLLGLIPPALMLAGYNWVRAGNPLQTGYDLTIFSPNLLLGLYKLLFSPLRGLFVYSPLLILSIPGLVWLWQRHRAETALAVGTAGVTILLFSAWTSGEGLSWGSRFLVPVLPFLCLPLAPVLERALAGSKALVGLLLALGLLSFAFQFLGIAINPWIYLAQLQAEFGGEFFLENTPALADFRYMQVIGQIQSWSLANSDVAWWQPWGFDAISFGLSLFLALATATNLASLPLRASKSQISNLKSQTLKLIALSILTPLITYILLTRYFISDRQFGPPNDSYTRALNAAVSQASPGDQIVTVAPYHYHVPMNRLKARMPIVGFAQVQPPLPETALPLLKDTAVGQNTWLTTVGLPPAAPDNAVEQWLTFNAFKASDEWFEDVRLVRYGTYPPTVTRSIDVTLGETLGLVKANVTGSRQPGQTLPVEFTWLPLHQPNTDYHVFLQLLAADGTLVAQHDGPPNGGYTPTSTWPSGAEVSDRHGLVLPTDLPAGDYQLITGMYHPATGQRLTLSIGGDFVDLGMVTIR